MPATAALVATRYGWLLDAKVALLAVVLVIAARARSTWLPLLAQGAAQSAGIDNCEPGQCNRNIETRNRSRRWPAARSSGSGSASNSCSP